MAGRATSRRSWPLTATRTCSSPPPERSPTAHQCRHPGVSVPRHRRHPRPPRVDRVPKTPSHTAPTRYIWLRPSASARPPACATQSRPSSYSSPTRASRLAADDCVSRAPHCKRRRRCCSPACQHTCAERRHLPTRLVLKRSQARCSASRSNIAGASCFAVPTTMPTSSVVAPASASAMSAPIAPMALACRHASPTSFTIRGSVAAAAAPTFASPLTMASGAAGRSPTSTAEQRLGKTTAAAQSSLDQNRSYVRSVQRRRPAEATAHGSPLCQDAAGSAVVGSVVAGPGVTCPKSRCGDVSRSRWTA